MPLSLSRAIKEDRRDDFIAQEEARGVGPINETEFNEAASIVIKTPQSGGQTSRSPRRDGSSEK